MLRLKTIIASLLLTLPVAVFAHPGHADDSPLLHEVSHSLHYLVALIAISIWTAQALGRVLRARRLKSTQLLNRRK